MSNTQAAIKVADQLISRLFDHRQFTTGEINYFVKELDDNIGLEGIFDKILKINQNTCIVSDTSTNELGKCKDETAKELCDRVSSLYEKTEKLLKLEEEHKLKEAQLLGPLRDEREKKKQNCYRDNNAKLEQLNEILVAEELELERRFLKFEENLRNNK